MISVLSQACFDLTGMNCFQRAHVDSPAPDVDVATVFCCNNVPEISQNYTLQLYTAIVTNTVLIKLNFV